MISQPLENHVVLVGLALHKRTNTILTLFPVLKESTYKGYVVDMFCLNFTKAFD